MKIKHFPFALVCGFAIILAVLAQDDQSGMHAWIILNLKY
jgi:hypothetical protein